MVSSSFFFSLVFTSVSNVCQVEQCVWDKSGNSLINEIGILNFQVISIGLYNILFRYVLKKETFNTSNKKKKNCHERELSVYEISHEI